MSKVAIAGAATGTGTFTLASPATNTDRTLTLPDNSGTLATAESTLTQFNASGSAPVYACRAWVNFNGTGTVAIRASGNVSSISDNGTGDYTVNFTTAMPDANYGVQTMATWAADSSTYQLVHGINRTTLPTTTACRVNGVSPTGQGTGIDSLYFCVAIFR